MNIEELHQKYPDLKDAEDEFYEFALISIMSDIIITPSKEADVRQFIEKIVLYVYNMKETILT
ncbi:unnamed protein product [marine sediment metagenome]|uniref:Uncharacterized protein n=1 Tax=marine sediment metagenome TaxID=412755 RepID=X1JKV5_9ZZZZ